jgi:hypothetical protein
MIDFEIQIKGGKKIMLKKIVFVLFVFSFLSGCAVDRYGRPVGIMVPPVYVDPYYAPVYPGYGYGYGYGGYYGGGSRGYRHHRHQTTLCRVNANFANLTGSFFILKNFQKIIVL